MRLFPTLFISHGAPSLYRTPCAAEVFLRGLGSTLPQPSAILVVSAHWQRSPLGVTAAAAPGSDHDSINPNAPPEAQTSADFVYPAPGSPALAQRVQHLLQGAGLTVELDADQGWDHGLWAPLSLAYPEAQIPIVQVSLGQGQDPQFHQRLGHALAPLRREGVLIMASGSATHGLQAFTGQGIDDPPLDWAAEFDRWLAETIAAGDTAALLDYLNQAPHADRNHPTPEHFLPLFVALGAAQAGAGAVQNARVASETGGTATASERDPQADRCPGQRIHHSFNYSVMSMAAYRWD